MVSRLSVFKVVEREQSFPVSVLVGNDTLKTSGWQLAIFAEDVLHQKHISPRRGVASRNR
jgi:hypothetical protein